MSTSSMNGSNAGPPSVRSSAVPPPTRLPAGHADGPSACSSASLAVQTGTALPSIRVPCGSSITMRRCGEGAAFGSSGFL